MADKQNGRPITPLGLYDKPSRAKVTTIELVAILLSGVWMVVSGWFFMTLETPVEVEGPDGLRFLMTLLVIFLPVAMIWVGATAARSSRVMREESARLQAAIDAIRQAYVAQSQGRDLANEPAVTRKLDEIADAQRKTETALATFTSSRDRASGTIRPTVQPTVPEGTDNQAPLPLGTPAEEIGPPLSRADFLRAMNFPETAEDEEGFAALRKALKDRQAAQLIQASQDVLTLLSQDGIYMDDMRADLARPEIWRRFAAGERGRTIAKIGGIHDRSSLALTAGRMKQDPIFRDAAHHFLRRFDKMFQDFEQAASDTEISEMSETRTARAFMLLGRVAGIFD
ncbi:hypothetical protein TG4357_02889 [Thalassovita gelatinovora]|uniref:Uncharacterized protein n=1 Tax=Thalassovita gelatinovora TaxID=53501 RepID=A0A0P1FGT8_THAGE|nr:hypothetical protein [Thalassovita gelatinovora]QIZ81891.1 hypothetical protein HFZ77_16080 [Thalassovita gelatinovora]CUH67230.1 hypothetical protein TG4357_02889 [Thalassovita gelatinovora]SEP78068.1 hypothetical protein SAMN04488043_101371 [Thalassovita gelatinovora]